MDLPYPSRKDVVIDSQLNKIDKVYSKLMLSVKDIKQQQTLSKWTRDKIQKFIQNDDISKLQKYMQKYAIFYDRQIGVKSSKWNVIHFCSKYNSVNSLKFILCKIYQEDKEQYKKLVNQKTFQGYTPLMITVINHSKDAMLLLLHYGGIDIYQIDSKKMTAYEMSLNYNNQQAIKCLIQYEKKYKKRVSLNQKQLLKPLQLESILKESCYESFMNFIVNCFVCLRDDQENFQKRKSFAIQQNSIFNNQKDQKQLNINSNDQNNNFIIKNMKNLNSSILKSIFGGQQKIDKINIGRQDLMSQYDICWKKLSELNNQKCNLFQSFQPFDICENNIVIFNNLILFQCLSDHAWLLRKLIKIKSKNNQESENKVISKNANETSEYIVNIYQNNILKKIIVDQFIPFLKQREEPMFLSNSNQLWPMILQKALAKYYGSYMKLAQIRPQKIVQQLTGFLTKKFQLSQSSNFLKIGDKVYKQKSIISILQEFTTKGYLILLQGRQGTSLSPKQKTNTPHCYTILNYFQKGEKKLVLINCPYVQQQWKQKQKTQMMQLKLIKSHYNKHNQMCVWIQQNQFCYFFKSVIVSFIQSNYTRNQLKFKIQFNQKNQFQKKISTLDINSLVLNSQVSEKNISQIETERSLMKQQKRKSQKFESIIKTQTIFIKFKIQNDKSQPIIFLVKNANKNNQLNILNYEAWINQGRQIATFNKKSESQILTPQLIKLASKKGEYLLKVQFQIKKKNKNTQRKSRKDSSFNKENTQNIINYNKKEEILQRNKPLNDSEIGEKSRSQLTNVLNNEFLMLCWSQQVVQLQFIEENFAKIQWISFWKTYIMNNWLQKNKFSTLSILDKSIILAKTSSNPSQKQLFIKFKGQLGQQIQQSAVLEGKFQSQNQHLIKMVQQQSNPKFFYSVFSIQNSQNKLFLLDKQENYSFQIIEKELN